MDVKIFLKADCFNMVLVFHVVQEELFLVMHSKSVTFYLKVFLLLFEIIVNCTSNLLSGDKRD
jgi:hypothetical protein